MYLSLLKDIQYINSGGQCPRKTTRETTTSKTHWQSQTQQEIQEENTVLECPKQNHSLHTVFIHPSSHSLDTSVALYQ